jgi:hypothetical protein
MGLENQFQKSTGLTPPEALEGEVDWVDWLIGL